MKACISPRQKAIYEYIKQEVSSKGYPPSVREIAQAVGLSSPSTVHSHLIALEMAGYIKRDPAKPRAILICHVDDAPTTTSRSRTRSVSPTSTCSLPLLGQVAAGLPILAEESIEEYFDLPTSLVGSHASYLLKVKGDSMINAGINSGDLVVVEQCPVANNGDIVVALIDDEATVKRFYKEDDRVRLQPENDYMDPIYVRNPQILGKVTSLFRKL